MATALDLLMSTNEDVNLLSEESDICTIDAKTRAIFVPSTIVVGGVQSDKNAERIKFSCPKIVGDNLDLSKFSVRINFENVSSVDFNVSIKDQYICDDVAVDGENVTFSWLIGKNAARYMGTVRFIVCAVKTDSDSNISVEWNTAIAEVPVLEGIEIDQPQIGQEEKDVINQLLELTKSTSAEAVQNVNSAKEQAIKDIQSVSQPDTTLTVEGGLAEAKATGEAIGSLKEDLFNESGCKKIQDFVFVYGGYTPNVGVTDVTNRAYSIVKLTKGSKITFDNTLFNIKCFCVSKNNTAILHFGVCDWDSSGVIEIGRSIDTSRSLIFIMAKRADNGSAFTAQKLEQLNKTTVIEYKYDLEEKYVVKPNVSKSATVYVSTDGNDDNDGRTWNTAKLSIQSAIELLRGTGGTVEISAGKHHVQSNGGFKYCEYTKNSSLVLCKKITSEDIGKYIVSQYTWDVAIVESVVEGVSFTMTDPSGSEYKADDTGTTNTLFTTPGLLVPAGIKLRGRGSSWENNYPVQDKLNYSTTEIYDDGTGISILCEHPHQLKADSGQTSAGFGFEDFTLSGHATNMYGIATLNEWQVVAERVHLVKHGLGGLLVSANANSNVWRDCRFSANGYENGNWAVTGGVIYHIASQLIPYGPLRFDNCFFTNNHGWGIVGTQDFYNPKPAPSIRVTEGQFNLCYATDKGGGCHAYVSGKENRTLFDDCIFETAETLDLDISDAPVTAIACKFKSLTISGERMPYTVRVNSGLFEAIGCGFVNSNVDYQVQVKKGAVFNWRSCLNNASVFVADENGKQLAPSVKASSSFGTSELEGERLNFLYENRRNGPYETIPRLFAQSTTLEIVSNTVHFTYFTCDTNGKVNYIGIYSGENGAGGTPTTATMGLYAVSDNGNMTLLGYTENDTSILSKARTKYKKQLNSQVELVCGRRYAVGLFVSSSAQMPTLHGAGYLPNGGADDYAISSALANQQNLPDTVLSSDLSGNNAIAYYAYLTQY